MHRLETLWRCPTRCHRPSLRTYLGGQAGEYFLPHRPVEDTSGLTILGQLFFSWGESHLQKEYNERSTTIAIGQFVFEPTRGKKKLLQVQEHHEIITNIFNTIIILAAQVTPLLEVLDETPWLY